MSTSVRSDPTVRVKLIGAELRRHREAAGLSLRDAARRMGLHETKLCRMESGERGQKCEDVAGLLAIYNITGEKRGLLLQLTREAERTGLWQRNCSHFLRVASLQTLEAIAIRLINFEYAVVPGLLQTVPYARAILGRASIPLDEDEIGERVAARIHRQGVLRKRAAPHFLAVIAENALRNSIGGPEVMREQLAYLIEASRRPNIQLRIIPASVSNHPGLDGPFMRLQFRDRPGVIVLENRTSNLFLEDDEDLMAYNHVLIGLLDVALDEANSVALLRDRLAEEQLQQ
jgi:transcriptional regulator with XRE-family HTH domain